MRCATSVLTTNTQRRQWRQWRWHHWMQQWLWAIEVRACSTLSPLERARAHTPIRTNMHTDDDDDDDGDDLGRLPGLKNKTSTWVKMLHVILQLVAPQRRESWLLFRISISRSAADRPTVASWIIFTTSKVDRRRSDGSGGAASNFLFSFTLH